MIRASDGGKYVGHLGSYHGKSEDSYQKEAAIHKLKIENMHMKT